MTMTSKDDQFEQPRDESPHRGALTSVPLKARLPLNKLSAIDPTHAGAWRQLALEHQRSGQFAEALASFDRALAIEPSDAVTLSGRALSLYRLNRFAEALASYDRLMAIRPDDVEALNSRGAVLHQLKRGDEALASFEKALRLAPSHVPILINQAIALKELKRFEEALASYDRALVIDQNNVDALNNRGSVLLELKRFEEALRSYDRVLAINPRHWRALNNRAGALRELDRVEEALACYARALEIEPNSVAILFNRASVLSNLYRAEEALAGAENVLALDPRHAHAFSVVADAAMRICDWSRGAKLGRELARHVGERSSIINPLVFLSYHDNPALQLRCAETYLRDKLPIPPLPFAVRKDGRHEKPRVAYLSADFHEHATSYLMAELFERHDRSRFDVVGISFGPDDGSEMRSRVIKAFDHFHDVRARSDLEVAKLLRELEIDIAVDLKGYTQHARLGIFAHRPAPIQVSYLGFPGTTGADFIDYVIADEIVLPFDRQPFWSEKIVHLPECYQVNDTKRRIAERTPTRKECGLPERGFVFCSFNNNYKITPAFFDIWMRLLCKVEGSVLWLLRDNAAAERNLRQEAAGRGIDPARLIFADRLPLAEHLARHRLADLFLDTLPYNAHTTASDALWAGLPVLTTIGESFAGRVGASLLRAVGLPELVTHSLEEYEALALKLAREPSLLSNYRERLKKNRTTAPLFDTDRFRHHLEQAYATMLDMHDRGENPRGFAIAPTTGVARRKPNDPKQPNDGGGTTAMVGDFKEAFRYHKAGDLGEAVPRYQEVLRENSTHRDALYCLALARLQRNEAFEGQALLERLLTIAPDHTGALRQLGLLRQRSGRDADALVSFDRALALEPKDVANWRNRALSLYRLNRFSEALRSHDEVLAIEPEHAESLGDRGVVLHQLERFDEALASFDRALAISPRQVATLTNRAITLKEIGRLEEALESYDKVLAIEPNDVSVLNDHGTVLLELKHFERALVSYDRILALDPNHVLALNNRAVALTSLGRVGEAIACYDQALAIEPKSARSGSNRGVTLFNVSKFEEAIDDFEGALASEPEHFHLFDTAALASRRICDWRRGERFLTALRPALADTKNVISPFARLICFDDPALQLQCARAYLKQKAPDLSARIENPKAWRHDRARIAYVSSDFREHPVSYLIAELFELHDRKRFEVFGISFGPDDKSQTRARLVKAFDHFHDVRDRDDRQVAELLGELEIDIAVDLNGHTKNQRFGIFAHRPAPVQVSYLGFPGTTGADFIDYVIGDEIVLPFDQQPFWSEKIVHLPGCFQVNDRKREIAGRTPTRKECGLPERGFVFCSFNNSYKISPAFFDIWMRLLDKVEGSVLWLVRDGAAAERNLRREAAARDIDPERLVFADRLPLAEHLARYRTANLFLDTLPYNAGTTASDALWAALPVLTCLGKSFAARMAASLLHSVGLPELVTKSLDEYETLALRLARDPALLHAYRERLEKNRLTAPLFDTDRFRRHIEQAYTTMLEIERRGEPPRGFSVVTSTGFPTSAESASRMLSRS